MATGYIMFIHGVNSRAEKEQPPMPITYLIVLMKLSRTTAETSKR